MVNDERKQRILQHLQKSSDGVQYSPKKNTNLTPASPPPVILPEPTPIVPPPIESRKQKIMGHVKMSSEKFGDFSLDTSDSRKKQIQDHLKKSLDN